MSGKFVVSLTRAKDDTDRATVAFVVANAAVASEKDVVVFLNIEGTRLSQSGYADDIHESGFAPLKELITSFVEAGGKIYVCSPCFKKRSLDEDKLIPGAKIVGGAMLVEFMSEGCPSLSY
ncbi:DsrE family protein [Paraburkholderia tropica]|uniref:Peroxiredoxin n=1 Tax=Paraburkholderia tropica TaxID=92647 RepID=A0A1A5X195_9BURK|nr:MULTISPECIES: DsrE family protein [Paraburkholderia]MBB2978911.1 putative peroxiredoxin [Paraburkholderia tropica]MDE1138986.1 DsrE family protein [Paraburkholderia tropica]OBR47099.1 sulfur reduction protein DsrE [Paraburkholderia tropica]PXX18644.1 putative peroxiredoxin [Paraburkholderia tropica]PZW87176.1 putative peroxiredoxin [Paraburkholderia tropica]